MNSRATKTVAIIEDPSPELQLSITINKNEAIGISVLILAAVLWVFLLYKKFNRTQSQLADSISKLAQNTQKELESTSSRLLAITSKSAQDMSADFSRISNLLVESNRKTMQTLESSQLIPQGKVLVDLSEGAEQFKLSNGYVIRVERKFEHRAVAEEILGRELAPNEIVHHIYGPKTDDNSPENLCVMDQDQHDYFHAYLQRQKSIDGRYPPIAVQKLALKQHFEGLWTCPT